jgi:hypothetical protein
VISILLTILVYSTHALAGCTFNGSEFTNKADCASAVVSYNSDISRRCYFQSHRGQTFSSPESAAQNTETACLAQSHFVRDLEPVCSTCSAEKERVVPARAQTFKAVSPSKPATLRPPHSKPVWSSPATVEPPEPTKEKPDPVKQQSSDPAPPTPSQTSQCHEALAYAKSACEPQSQAQSFQPTGAGRLEYCQQLEAASQQTSQSNAAQAGSCYSAYSQCSKQCAAEGAYQLAKVCQTFKQSFDTYQAQAQNSGRANGYAQYCGSVSAAMPQSVTPTQRQNVEVPQASNSTPTLIEQEPSSAASGSSGYAKATQPSYSNSQAAYVPEGVQQRNSFIRRMNEALKYEQGSNSPTEGVPQSPTKARLDPPHPSPGDSGFDVQSLDQGFRSGGGYTYGGSEQLEQEAPTHAVSRSVASEASPYFLGMDLRKYLRRFFIGGNTERVRSDGIYGPSVDIFAKISARYREKCRLGNLLDCDK